jgi:hypothetical protein
MPETITLQALDLSGETLTMFLRKPDGTLLNTGGDAMTESGSTGVFTATLAEARTGLGPLAVRICSGSETADNLLYDGFLSEGSTVIDSTMTAELDSASRLAIWNTLTTETFTADSFGELLLISDGTNGREVKVNGAKHIAADVHEVQPSGLTASTDIIAIKAKTTNLPTDPADQSLVEAAITAATSPLATPAQVNAQVLDVLSVDTFGELSSPPAATSSLKDKLVWLFMWARNKATATSSQRKLYADDTTTVVSTETVGDDGVTFTKGEAS